MEAARCDLCGKPVSSWLEVCGKLNVCLDCAATVTLVGLAGAGYARIQPDTFQMDGNALVTKDVPDVILDYQNAKQQLNTAYGLRVESVYETAADDTNTRDVLKLSYNWTIDEIVQYIKDLGFATEKAFYVHCAALMEGGYTEETSYALILRNRYEDRTVCDEIGTHYNALEGQTPEEAINLFIESEKEFEKDHPEYAFGTSEQKAMLEAQKSLVTKESESVS